MLTDKNLLCCSAQAVYSDGTSVLGTGSVDLSSAKDLAPGEPLSSFARVTTAFAGGTSCAFEIVSADNAALSSNLVVLATTPAILTATLAEGYVIPMPDFVANSAQDRYIGIRATCVGTMTAGSITAGFIPKSAKKQADTARY